MILGEASLAPKLGVGPPDGQRKMKWDWDRREMERGANWGLVLSPEFTEVGRRP
jgi:hypothetical protein